MRVFVCILVLGVMVSLPRPVNAEDKPAEEILCILDFNRLGNDASMDWLKRGLSDMMITAMNRLSPYEIIDREHLKETLKEHGLVSSGLVDTELGIKQARLAKAQLLLLGNFARQQEKVTIRVRLIRIFDQKILSISTWDGQPSRVLSAPTILCKKLLAGIDKPFDPKLLEGIEKQIPSTVNVAESFYKGMEAFDNGKYPESLAHYLDGSIEAGEFLRIYKEVIRMYYLLEQNEHAVIFANKIAQRLDKDDRQHSLEFYYDVAEKCLASLKNQKMAVELLEKIVRLAKQYEEETHEAEKTKQFVKEKVLKYYKTAKYRNSQHILTNRDLQYKIWHKEIEDQLRDMNSKGGYYWIQRGDKWIKEPIPEPTVFMWKIRTQLSLARLYVRQAQVQNALKLYKDIINEYAFLNQLSIFPENERFYWKHGIRLEAHFMILYHYKQTGQLIRDKLLMSKVNEVKKNSVFKRDFKNPDPDPRARVWSRHENGAHEYFDLIAPEGYQIESVILQAEVKGLAKFSIYLPDAKGWPPRYDISKRLAKFNFFKGTHKKKIDLPEGTEFFSISVLWGPRWADNPWEYFRGKIGGSAANRDIVLWQATFIVSHKQQGFVKSPDPDFQETDQRILEHYAGKYGWDEGFVLREEKSIVYSGKPTWDVFALEWITYSSNGDINIFLQNNPEIKIEIPVTINTNETEYDPTLVRTHEGTYALLWTRGPKKNPIGYFFSKTRDFLHWDTPRRMDFEKPEGDIGYFYKSDPLERTFNIVPIPGGYMMLLAQGFTRFSRDLKHWRIPRQIFKQDGWRNSIVKSKDERIWVVYAQFLREKAKPPFHFPYAIRVASSIDGKYWEAAKEIFVGEEPSDLWAFPVADSQIGIAVQHNNLYLKWFISLDRENFRKVDSPVNLLLTKGVIEFFPKDGKIFCVRPVHDFVEQQWVVLMMSSKEIYRRLFK